MLRELRVLNLALLEEVAVPFGPGLNAVTGATGAGKSLLVQALALLLGGRFGREMLRTDAAEARICGLFRIGSADVRARVAEALGEESLDDDLVLERRVDASGRNRCEAQGRLVPVGKLREIGRALVEIHGQSEHQELLEPAQQTRLLDRAAGLVEARAEFAQALARWHALREELDSRRTASEERAARLEAAESAADEIRAAGLRVGEQEELRGERALLGDAARHGEALALALALIQGGAEPGEEGAADRLGRAARALEDTAALSPAVREASALLDEALLRIDEAARGVQAALERVEPDPARLEVVEERLERIGQVLRRHGPGEQDALDALARAEAEAHALRADEADAGALEARIRGARAEVLRLGRALDARRREAGRAFAASVGAALTDLGMPGTRFEVAVEEQEDPARATALGLGGVAFLVSPNPGEELRPLARIASGGELARVALAIKGELAGADDVPLLVFDEVDADVGPRLGAVIGRRLEALARGRQVLVVTHLAQVAECADVHVRVAKRTAGLRTVSEAEVLEGRAREAELGEMRGESARSGGARG